VKKRVEWGHNHGEPALEKTFGKGRGVVHSHITIAKTISGGRGSVHGMKGLTDHGGVERYYNMKTGELWIVL